MFFRFAAGLILVVLVSMLGIVLEKQTLDMNRTVSRQYFQIDMLLEMHARLRLSIQELTAPALLADLPADDVSARLPAMHQQNGQKNSDLSVSERPTLPLMRWQLPPRNVR